MPSRVARTVSLPDGSVVGYIEYGDPTGRPVLAFHGVPASGAGFAWADKPAKDRGLRVLAPDRPGVGLSSRSANGWTVADYARIVADFADALGLEKFGVWGYSGGGPYAVACAAHLPDRLTGVVVAAGMGQVGVWASTTDFEKTDRQLLELSRRRPWLARRIMALAALGAKVSPKMAVRSFADELCPADLEVLSGLGSPADQMLMFTAAFTKGSHGVVDDYAAIAQPWGFDVGTITTTVDVMQGSDDTMVPLRHAEALVAALPDAVLTVWPGEGHLGTIRHVGDILDRFG